MDPTILAIIALILGLAIGAGAGWFVGSRPVADARAKLAEAEEASAEREGEFKTAIKELGEAQIELATLKANAANFDKQMAQMAQAREEMLAQFKALGSEVLSKSQEEFLKRADERFKQSEEAGALKVQALLKPIGDSLDRHRKHVEQIEKNNSTGFDQLKAVMGEVQKGQEGVRREAQRLGDSLTNQPKARGRWGEKALKNVLEQCGLSQHTDFELEQSVETEEGRLRPDALVRIPGGKLLVIDAKVSLNAYQAAFEAEDRKVRENLMDEHVRSMKSHVTQLASKGYQSQFEDAPDYVVMFVPGEHFVAAALEHEPDLWDFAFDKRVLLATPTNLVAIARTVAQVWRQQELAAEAQEIGRLGGELYDRLAKATGDLANLGTHLNRAVGSYNTFNSSFESRVLVSARKMSEKGVEIGKREIEEIGQIEASARLPKVSEEPLTDRGANEETGK